MTIETEVALRAMLSAMIKAPMGLPEYSGDQTVQSRVGRASDSEAEEIRALLRHPPLVFYGELEDQTRQLRRWMI